MCSREGHDLRARDVLARFEPHTLELLGAEVGVFCGDMSRALLVGHPGLRLLMVDTWAPFERDTPYTRSLDPHADATEIEQATYLQAAMDNVEFAGMRAKILQTTSAEAARTCQPGSLDFVFLDADHSYEAVKADIEAWRWCVKPGGWLCGHDYANPWFPKFGVKKAVDEFAGDKLLLGYDLTWFVRIGADGGPG